MKIFDFENVYVSINKKVNRRKINKNKQKKRDKQHNTNKQMKIKEIRNINTASEIYTCSI